MNHNRSTALERSVNITGPAGGGGGGSLNWFYGITKSPSASVMAQNIKLFGSPSQIFSVVKNFSEM